MRQSGERNMQYDYTKGGTNMTVLKRTVSFLIIILLSACSSACYADSFATVTIGGKLTIDDDRLLNEGQQCFFLIPSEGSPMPEETENGVKKAITQPGGSFSFGEIIFEKPGSYEYTVCREERSIKNAAADNSVFRVRVDVFSDGTYTLIYQREGSEGKPDEIIYSDTFTPDHTIDRTKVKTGDSLSLNKYILSFASALIILILCRFLLYGKR